MPELQEAVSRPPFPSRAAARRRVTGVFFHGGFRLISPLVFVYFLRYSDDPHEFKKVQKDDIVKDKRMKEGERDRRDRAGSIGSGGSSGSSPGP